MSIVTASQQSYEEWECVLCRFFLSMSHADKRPDFALAGPRHPNYHGWGAVAGYFEGWYVKLVSPMAPWPWPSSRVLPVSRILSEAFYPGAGRRGRHGHHVPFH